MTPALCSVLRWWLAVDFAPARDLAALDLACLVAAGELAHDLEAHGIGERLQDGEPPTVVEIGVAGSSCSRFIV